MQSQWQWHIFFLEVLINGIYDYHTDSLCSSSHQNWQQNSTPAKKGGQLTHSNSPRSPGMSMQIEQVAFSADSSSTLGILGSFSFTDCVSIILMVYFRNKKNFQYCVELLIKIVGDEDVLSEWTTTKNKLLSIPLPSSLVEPLGDSASDNDRDVNESFKYHNAE